VARRRRSGLLNLEAPNKRGMPVKKRVRPRTPAQIAAGIRNLVVWRASMTPQSPEAKKLFRKLRAGGLDYETAWREVYSPLGGAVEDLSPADRVTRKFGSIKSVWSALDELARASGNKRHRRNLSTLYRWFAPRTKGGTGGRIPSAAIDSLHLAAKRRGVKLRPEDFF